MPLAVRELAEEMLPADAKLAEGMATHLLATIPELDPRDDDLREETRASCEANISQILQLYKLGVGVDALVLPVEAAELVRGLVLRGITLATLLRMYRLGHAWFWDQWAQALKDRSTDPDILVAAQDQSSAFLFTYIDRISDVLVGEYGTERDRLMRSAEQVRAETTRAILAREPVDEEVASRRLGYMLRRHHLAFRVSSVGREPVEPERAATEAADMLDMGDPLVVRAGVASFDVWCGSYELPDPEPSAALEAFDAPEGIRVAIGTSGHGLEGFRRSHDEAVQAAHVASLARGTVGPVTSYKRVELVSLLASDLPRARTFVASRLGRLAGPGEPAARLRDTVLAFLAAGGSSTRVAKQLYIHQNTVAYRVKRAEDLLGRRVNEDPIELTCALTLAAVLGPAVIAGDDGTAGAEP
jgi:DNA-binding PucR family transcriptional regulator